MRQRLGESVAGRVAVDGNPLLVKDADTDPFLTKTARRYNNNYSSKSFLSVPVEFLGNLLGVVNVTEKSTGNEFDDSDLKAVLDISRGLGFSLYGVQTYLQKQKELNGKLMAEVDGLKKALARERVYASLGKLVGNFMHEMNNPLDGVIRYVNLAFDCSEENSIIREYLGESRTGLTRIANIVRSLLDFLWSNSREVGKIDVNFILMESIFVQKHTYIYRGIEVEKVLDENIPLIPDHGLQIVFNNLIKNACDAMEKGGTLSISTELRGDSIEIKVSDSGKGIPPEIRGKIFEPFFTTKKKGEGTGIGLAVCSEIIQRYKGEISVKSTEEKGSSFIVTLPVLRVLGSSKNNKFQISPTL